MPTSQLPFLLAALAIFFIPHACREIHLIAR
jgi:hypothetical protein